jgi:hypothetical protein
MRKGTISRGLEDFFMRVEELQETNHDTFTPQQEKELSKAVHS